MSGNAAIDPAPSIDVLRGVLARLGEGRAVDASPIQTLVDDLADTSRRCPGVLVRAAVGGLPQSGCEGLAAHAWRTGALAIAVGCGLGWGESDVRILGAAALLADVGVALLGPGACDAPGPLDDRARGLVHRHPAISGGILAAAMRLPEESLLAVWQHHERDDGSGYPRSLRAKSIIDHARVIAVIDTFVAAASDRPHRRGAEPHVALRNTLELARRGVLWEAAAVRLVRLIGLYPIGSRVRLSCDEAGTVIAVPEPSRPHRPIVEVRSRSGDARLVDLSREGEELAIVAALPAPREW